MENTQQNNTGVQDNVNVNLAGGGDINLMPVMSQEEVQAVEKKSSFDFKAVIFILVVAAMSVIFSFYNLYVVNTLEQEKDKLVQLENDLIGDIDLIRENNILLDKYHFYNYIQDNFFSSKEVLVFWQEVSEDLCEITSITLTEDLGYEISGNSESLMNVAKFWHFLSLDSRVSEVHLDRMTLPDELDSQSPDEVRFTFKGKLNIKYFDRK